MPWSLSCDWVLMYREVRSYQTSGLAFWRVWECWHQTHASSGRKRVRGWNSQGTTCPTIQRMRDSCLELLCSLRMEKPNSFLQLTTFHAEQPSCGPAGISSTVIYYLVWELGNTLHSKYKTEVLFKHLEKLHLTGNLYS